MSSKDFSERLENGEVKACDVSHSDPLHVFQSLDKVSKERSKKLSIEEIYQRKTQLEHILLRPDTYIGSIEPHTDLIWVYDGESERMVQRNITYVPGLYKIFDEIIVNAADNKQRDPKMNCIQVNINPEKNEIKVWNNGKGIPVVEHKVEKMFVPELIFGTLLTSSNYDDSERKVTGGRNGYGAKLCNIFSKKFTVETSSREYRKKFNQTWRDNMTKSEKPVISPSSDEDYTCVKFTPDLSKFGMTELDKDIVALMCRRAYDIAGTCPGVKVYLNGKRIHVDGFRSYIDLYTKDMNNEDGEPLNIVYERPHARWEVAVTVSERGFQQVSFVNSIATIKGGRHVDYVTEALVEKIIDIVKRQLKKTGQTIRPFQVKNHMWVFLNCLIENPTFDSQTKENMTLPPKSFGSKCTVSDKFLGLMAKSGIVDRVMQWMKFKAQAQLNKQCHSTKHSKLRGVPKLEDANEAGTKNSHRCTLILTEGDSAKTLAVAGFSIVGRDYYGVFPLRGKLLNVREASHKQIMGNAEINHLIKILGLQYKRKYETEEDLRSLRYGKVMIMTDQDQDGSHIKGLVINFIHHNWPSLIRHNFVEEFITPIVKVTKGNQEKPFFSLPEYEKWKAETNNWHTWKIKYYKGLGTSTAKEAKEYFSDMRRHRIRFRYDGNDDDKALELAFSKKKVEDRKDWLTSWMQVRKSQRLANQPETYLYKEDTTAVTYKEFVDKELVLFSNMDNERSIPSLVDGLKPGQRKVLFTCFKRNDKREVKVAQLAGSIAEMSAYHHGEVSLMSTIVNLAHNFVGSNNINLLMPIGQFGTRLMGGKDAASARYIFTRLSPIAKALFPQEDEACLNHLFDDNQKIEPEWYCPIVPMVLVNGAEGIGTAWSTKVPNFNPRQLVDNIRRLIRDEPLVPMQPWYKNFKGELVNLGSGRYACFGEVGLLDDGRLEISELPIGVWTQHYKESVLEVMLYGAENKQPLIQDYKEYHTDTTVRFIVQISPDKLAQVQREGVHKVFKLQNFINTTQMVLFDAEGCLRRFDSAEEILRSFYVAEASRLRNQARFILEKIEGIIKIENLKKQDIVKQLVDRNYDPDPVKAWKDKQLQPTSDELLEEEDEPTSDEMPESPVDIRLRNYDYLLSMAVVRLSLEEKDKLLRDRDCKVEQLEALRQKTPKDLWLEDLDKFIVELDDMEAKERREERIVDDGGSRMGNKGKRGKGGGRFAAKKTNANDTLPSEDAIRIEPLVTDDIRLKVEKAAHAKQRVVLLKEAELRGDTEALDILKGRKKKIKKEEGIGGGDATSTGVKSKRTAKKGEAKAKPEKDDNNVAAEEAASDKDDSTDEVVRPIRSVRKRQTLDFILSDGESDAASGSSLLVGGNSDTYGSDPFGVKEEAKSTASNGTILVKAENELQSLASLKRRKVNRLMESDDSDFEMVDCSSDSTFEPTEKRKRATPKKKESPPTAPIKGAPKRQRKKPLLLTNSSDGDDDAVGKKEIVKQPARRKKEPPKGDSNQPADPFEVKTKPDNVSRAKKEARKRPGVGAKKISKPKATPPSKSSDGSNSNTDDPENTKKAKGATATSSKRKGRSATTQGGSKQAMGTAAKTSGGEAERQSSIGSKKTSQELEESIIQFDDANNSVVRFVEESDESA
uniref:DNA topoisomerase 2 n=1 Tax=Trichuris muris TaxID=70415 RepID=A0A5S6QLN5_TRIMR